MMAKMITAEQARKITQDNLLEINTQNWNKLMESIERKAKAGDPITYSTTWLTEKQIEHLQQAGYTVTRSEINSCHQIQW